MKPLVSIIVPVYNTENYIHACLESLEMQTCADIEAIIVDDGSTDGSAAIAEGFAARDGRFRVFRLDSNGGPGVARNIGIAAASGEYVMFLDSDDRFARDAVELLCGSIASSGCDFVLGRMYQQQDGRLVSVDYVEERIMSYYSYHESNLRKCPPEYAYFGSVTHRIFKRSFLTDNNIRFIEGIYWEDVPFSLSAWLRAKKIGFIPNIITFYTLRDDSGNPSISHSLNMKKLYDRDVIFDYVARKANAVLDDEYSLALVINFVQRLLATTVSIVPMVDDGSRDQAEAWYRKHEMKVCGKLEDWRTIKAELAKKPA